MVIVMDSIIYKSLDNKYTSFEKNSPTKFTRRCIDNSITGCNKCVGYCEYRGHPGFLTRNLIRQHDCINKECYYFIAKPKRERKNNYQPFNLSSVILSHLRNTLSLNEAIKVISVKNDSLNKYTAFYITFTNECEFSKCITEIYEEFKVEVDFVRLNYSFETCVELICAQ